MNTLTKQQVFEAVVDERSNQDEKWGVDKPQSLPGYMLIIQSELNEALEGWTKNKTGKHAPLNEIVQIADVCFACLEKYGVTGSTIANNDIVANLPNPANIP